MTLIELVVVLVIIMALAASSLVIVDRMSEQAWIERTDRNLDAIVASIDGGSRSDGAVGGFLADMGRWPKAPALSVSVGMEPTDDAYRSRWQELTLGTNASDGSQLPEWKMYAPAGDPDIRLACGWRGPYLTSSQITDGWDSVIRIRGATGMLDWSTAGEIHGGLSLGQDHAADVVAETTTAADRERTSRVGTSSAIPVSVRCVTTAGAPVTSGYLILRVYAIRNGSVQCVWQSTGSKWDLAAPGSAQPISEQASADPLIGSIALRAYHVVALPAYTPEQIIDPATKGAVIYRTIAPWTTPGVVDLIVVVP